MYEGNGRLADVLLAAGGEAEMLGCMTDEEITPSFRIDIQLESALHARPLSPFEQYLGYSEWLKANPGATAKDLAARIRKDAGMFSKSLSPGRCIPAVVEAARAGLLTLSDWYRLDRALPVVIDGENSDCGGLSWSRVRQRVGRRKSVTLL